MFKVPCSISRYVWYLNVLFSTIFSYTVCKWLINSQMKIYLAENIYQSLALVAIFILIINVLFQIADSLKSKDIACCLKNINANSILYLIITVFLLFGQKQQTIYQEGQLLIILQLFIWGRIIFALGYLLGVIIGAQSFRSYGFGLCVASICSLISPLFGVNFLALFK